VACYLFLPIQSMLLLLLVGVVGWVGGFLVCGILFILLTHALIPIERLSCPKVFLVEVEGVCGFSRSVKDSGGLCYVGYGHILIQCLKKFPKLSQKLSQL
jgi:hypothetical protein